MIGAKELLTDLYDCPRQYNRYLKNSSYIANDVCISIMAASTLTWLKDNTQRSDFEGGFLTRFIFLSGTKPEPPKAFPPTPDKKEKQNLIDTLKKISSLSGKVTIDEDARDRYEDWYTDNYTQLSDEMDENILLSSLYTRLQDYVLKFAMINQVADNCKLAISIKNMERAIMLVEELKNNISDLIANGLIGGKKASEINRVEGIIRKSGSITRAKLIHKSKMLAKNLNQVIETLLEKDTINENNDLNTRTKIYQWKG